MRDQRAEALAQILVNYSTRVQPGDTCVVQATSAAEPLVQAVYEEVLRAGGLPVVQMTTNGAQAPRLIELEWIRPTIIQAKVLRWRRSSQFRC